MLNSYYTTHCGRNKLSLCYKSIWEKCLSQIKDRVNLQSYRTWFADSEGVSGDNNSIVVKIKDQFTADWLEQHYLNFIFKIIAQVTGDDNYELSF